MDNEVRHSKRGRKNLENVGELKINFLCFAIEVGIVNCLVSIKIISCLAFGAPDMLLMPELGYLIRANPPVRNNNLVPSVQGLCRQTLVQEDESESWAVRSLFSP